MVELRIDTAVDEFERVVEAVYAAYGRDIDWDWDDRGVGASTAGSSAQNGSRGSGVAPAPAGSVRLPNGWTEKRLRKWATYLTPNAAEAIRYVCQHAPEVPIDDVMAHLSEFLKAPAGIDGKLLGGTMSSGGHAMRRVSRELRHQPVQPDHDRRLYVVDEHVAVILLDALGT